MKEIIGSLAQTLKLGLKTFNLNRTIYFIIAVKRTFILIILATYFNKS